MRLHQSLFLALATSATLCAAQTTERTPSPADTNPACTERTIDSNSPGCLTNEPGPAARVVAPPANQAAQPPAGEFPATPGLKPAPVLPPIGQKPLAPANPTLPPVGQTPLVSPAPNLPAAGSQSPSAVSTPPAQTPSQTPTLAPSPAAKPAPGGTVGSGAPGGSAPGAARLGR